MKFKKKAVSPLIATILLIVVAVILVTIVLTWGKNFASDSLASAGDIGVDSCSGSSLVLSNCQIIGTDAIFTVRNNSSNDYTFPSTDVLKVFITDDSGNSSSAEADLNTSASATWDVELAPGQNQGAKVDVDGFTGNITINVRSMTCPNDAMAEIVCR
jgi:flagellin-like protein